MFPCVRYGAGSGQNHCRVASRSTDYDETAVTMFGEDAVQTGRRMSNCPHLKLKWITWHVSLVINFGADGTVGWRFAKQLWFFKVWITAGGHFAYFCVFLPQSINMHWVGCKVIVNETANMKLTDHVLETDAETKTNVKALTLYQS